MFHMDSCMQQLKWQRTLYYASRYLLLMKPIIWSNKLKEIIDQIVKSNSRLERASVASASIESGIFPLHCEDLSTENTPHQLVYGKVLIAGMV